MGFEYIDPQSEKALQKMIDGHLTNYVGEYTESILKYLVNCKYIQAVEIETGSGDNLFQDITVIQKGKSYFEMKSNYEASMERNRSVTNNIQTGNNSPVNTVIGNNNHTIQTVDYANNEQLNALSGFVTTLNTSTELSQEQKDDVLELIESIQETTKRGGKVKALLRAGKALLSGTVILADKWEQIQVFFSQVG